MIRVFHCFQCKVYGFQLRHFFLVDGLEGSRVLWPKKKNRSLLLKRKDHRENMGQPWQKFIIYHCLFIDFSRLFLQWVIPKWPWVSWVSILRWSNCGWFGMPQAVPGRKTHPTVKTHLDSWGLGRAMPPMWRLSRGRSWTSRTTWAINLGGARPEPGWFFSPGAGRLRTTGSFGGGRLLCAALRLCDLTHLAQPCFERENLEFDNRFASHKSTIHRGFPWIYHELTNHSFDYQMFILYNNQLHGSGSGHVFLQRNPGQHHDRGEEWRIIRKIAFRCSFDLA